jgi:hypothetical protein
MLRFSKLRTSEEDELINRLLPKASAFRASAALKRSRQAAVTRARTVGCPFQTITASRKNGPIRKNEWRVR